MKTKNSNKAPKTEHWLYIDDHLSTDIHFIKTVQCAKTLREVRIIFEITEQGIVVNHGLIIDRWKNRISKGNTRLESILRKDKIDLGFNIQKSSIFNSNGF